VEYVIGRDEQIVTARSWDELERLLQNHPATVAMVDPSWEAVSRKVEFERIANSYPSLPVIAYVPLTPAAFRSVAELSKLGLQHVILYSHDDSAEHLVATIDRVRSSPLTDRFLGTLRPQLSRMPVPIVKVVEEMFAEPHKYPSAQELAIGAHVSLVKLYRAFRKAQFASPKKMLQAARLLRAFAHLRDPGQSILGVSKKLAYGNPRILAGHAYEVFGVNPSRMRTHLTEEQVIATLRVFVAKEAA